MTNYILPLPHVHSSSLLCFASQGSILWRVNFARNVLTGDKGAPAQGSACEQAPSNPTAEVLRKSSRFSLNIKVSEAGSTHAARSANETLREAVAAIRVVQQLCRSKAIVTAEPSSPQPLPLHSRSEISFQIKSQSHHCAITVRNTNSYNKAVHQNHLKVSNFNAADPYTSKVQVELKGRTIWHRNHLYYLRSTYHQNVLDETPKTSAPQEGQKPQAKKNQTHHPRPISNAKVLLSGYLGLQDRPCSQFCPHRAIGSVSWDLLHERSGTQGTRAGAQHRSG